MQARLQPDELLIDDIHFRLEPVLRAVRNQDLALFNKIVDQGYYFSWTDRVTHKTLLEQLGEDQDLVSIDFLKKHFSNIDLSAAVMGAAFTNASIETIKMIPAHTIDNKDDSVKFYSAALEGAAKGKHAQLLQQLYQQAPQTKWDEYFEDIVRGMEQSNDAIFIKKCCSMISSQLASYHYAAAAHVTGAALGGHVEKVEKILKDVCYSVHDHNRRNNMLNSFGTYIAAIKAAASRGNETLVFRIFTYWRYHPEEFYQNLIAAALETAATFGHAQLVNDLLAYDSLYRISHGSSAQALSKALHISVRSHHFAVAKVLLRHGARFERITTIQIDGDSYQHIVDADFHTFKKHYDLQALDYDALHARFRDDELLAWLSCYEREKNAYPAHLPKDLFILIGSYITRAPHPKQKPQLTSERYPAWWQRKAQSAQLEQYQVLTIHEALNRQPDPLSIDDPEPDPVIIKLKAKILNELNEYLQTTWIYHRPRALDLSRMITGFTAIEPIYQLLNQELWLLSSSDESNEQEYQDPAARVFTTPHAKGHSFFQRFIPYPDLIQRLEKCVQFVKDQHQHPVIKAMLETPELYVPIKRDPKFW